MIDEDITPEIIQRIKTAASYGGGRGRDKTPEERAYYRRCSHFHYRTGTLLIYTRDAGHHTSGWMKNPDFERCLHLSLSFRHPAPQAPPKSIGNPQTLANLGAVIPTVPFDKQAASVWIRHIFGERAKLSWHEGAFSPEGRALDVQHWRVFCDTAWKPIMPRGEVYSTELTERGWKSWSEVQGENAPQNWISAT
jgi:hypothetical protein